MEGWFFEVATSALYLIKEMRYALHLILLPCALGFTPPSLPFALRAATSVFSNPGSQDDGAYPESGGDKLNSDLRSRASQLNINPAEVEAAGDEEDIAVTEKPRVEPTRSLEGGREVFVYSAKTATSNPRPSNSDGRFGIPIDGSLLIIVPTLIIGILGVVTGLMIATNQRDEIEEAMEAVKSQAAASEKVKERGTCRGICYDQSKDLERKRERILDNPMAVFF